MRYSFFHILWLPEGLCLQHVLPSAIIHCCASGQIQTAQTQVNPPCSGALPNKNQNWRNLIKSLECQVKVNRNYTAPYYYVTLFIFLRSSSDFKTNDHSNQAVAKIGNYVKGRENKVSLGKSGQ